MISTKNNDIKSDFKNKTNLNVFSLLPKNWISEYLCTIKIQINDHIDNIKC